MGITQKMGQNGAFYSCCRTAGKNKVISPHKTGDVHRNRRQIDHHFARLLSFSLVQPQAIPPFASAR